MTDTVPLVTVVLLNWHNSDDTLACLTQLSHANYPRLRVVVIDNASGDDSVRRIRSAFPDVPLIRSQTNRGFAGGMNLGIQYAAGYGADYVLLLNSDVTFDRDMLSILIAHAESYEQKGLFSPKIYREAAAPTYWIYGFQLTSAGFSVLGEGAVDRGQFDRTAIDGIYGCALLIPREIIFEVGLLDERFFFFAEDVDYCMRVRQAGYPVRVVPQAQLRHAIHGTTRTNSGWRQFMSARSRMRLFRKHFRRFDPILLVFAEILETLRIIRCSLRYADIRAIVGYFCGIAAGLEGARGGPPLKLPLPFTDHRVPFGCGHPVVKIHKMSE